MLKITTIEYAYTDRNKSWLLHFLVINELGQQDYYLQWEL